MPDNESIDLRSAMERIADLKAQLDELLSAHMEKVDAMLALKIKYDLLKAKISQSSSDVLTPLQLFAGLNMAAMLAASKTRHTDRQAADVATNNARALIARLKDE
jgi:hypothetical protein